MGHGDMQGFDSPSLACLAQEASHLLPPFEPHTTDEEGKGKGWGGAKSTKDLHSKLHHAPKPAPKNQVIADACTLDEITASIQKMPLLSWHEILRKRRATLTPVAGVCHWFCP